jgi:hypothetical protein
LQPFRIPRDTGATGGDLIAPPIPLPLPLPKPPGGDDSTSPALSPTFPAPAGPASPLKPPPVKPKG